MVYILCYLYSVKSTHLIDYSDSNIVHTKKLVCIRTTKGCVFVANLNYNGLHKNNILTTVMGLERALGNVIFVNFERYTFSLV